MNHKYLKSMLTPLVILLAVISANNFRSGVTVAEGKYIDFSLIETKISPTTTLPMESTVVKMNNTSLNGKRKKVVTLQDLMRSNTTEVGTNYKIAKPPRRNDKALRIEKGRGKIYSYYYLGRSVLYFILYYLLFYVLYFTAHIVRSIFLHRISTPPGHLVAGASNYKYEFLVKRSVDDVNGEGHDPYLLELTGKVISYIENFKTWLRFNETINK